MGCIICLGTTNEDVQKFEHNKKIVLEQLRKSESGKSAEERKAQLLNIISMKDIKEQDELKAKLFEGGNASLRKAHRLDLPN